MMGSPESTKTPYAGPERRQHRVFITRNSEYHTRNDVCVAVFDRRTHQEISDHAALGKRMTTGIDRRGEGGIRLTPARDIRPGDALMFEGPKGERHEVITSPLVSIGRPPKTVVERYRSS